MGRQTGTSVQWNLSYKATQKEQTPDIRNSIDASQKLHTEGKKPDLPTPQILHVSSYKWGKLCYGDGNPIGASSGEQEWRGKSNSSALFFDAHLLRLMGQYT